MKNLLKILLLTFLLSCGKELEEPGPPVIETAEDLKEFLEGEWIDAFFGRTPESAYVARFWEDSLLVMSHIHYDVSQIAYYHVIDKDSIRIRREFLWLRDSLGWIVERGSIPSKPIQYYIDNFKISRNKIHIYTRDSIRIERYEICGCLEGDWVPITFKRVKN